MGERVCPDRTGHSDIPREIGLMILPLGYFGSLTRGAAPSPTRAAGAAPTTMEEVAGAPNPTRAKALQRSQDRRRRVVPQSPG